MHFSAHNETSLCMYMYLTINVGVVSSVQTGQGTHTHKQIITHVVLFFVCPFTHTPLALIHFATICNGVFDSNAVLIRCSHITRTAKFGGISTCGLYIKFHAVGGVFCIVDIRSGSIVSQSIPTVHAYPNSSADQVTSRRASSSERSSISRSFPS